MPAGLIRLVQDSLAHSGLQVGQQIGLHHVLADANWLAVPFEPLVKPVPDLLDLVLAFLGALHHILSELPGHLLLPQQLVVRAVSLPDGCSS